MRELVREGLGAYRRYHAEIRAADPRDLESIAHKIRGSAGTLGLRRIADTGGEIEEAVKQGDDPARPIARLERALDATHGELVRLGILRVERIAP